MTDNNDLTSIPTDALVRELRARADIKCFNQPADEEWGVRVASPRGGVLFYYGPGPATVLVIEEGERNGDLAGSY